MLLRTLLVLQLSLLAFAQRAVTDAEVRRVHRSAILIDTHNDVTSATVDGLDLAARATKGQTDIPRLKEGGVSAVFFAAYVGASYASDGRSAHRALQMIDTIRTDIAARYPKDFVLATTAAEIVRAKRTGKIAALIGIEGGHAIEDDLRLLRGYHALGVRYMTLTHTNTNGWADSSGDGSKPDVKRHDGLNELGRKVIAEMNRLGMLVDISHVSDKTFWDVMEASRVPAIASHSSCRALAAIPRNMTDDMIRALAKKGGVVQLNFGCEFLSQASADSSPYGNPAKFAGLDKAALAEAQKNVVRATIDDVLAHIEHVRKIAGIDAVGLGSDFDGVECTPVGLDDNSKWPNLTRKLLERGYTKAEIHKIYGGNLLRVMREAERFSAAASR